jgi:hypothetical protein
MSAGGADVSLDQMVAVHRGGHRGLVPAREHELEQRHLRGGVLHRDAVGVQADIARARLELRGRGLGEVAVEDLLGVGERAVQALAHRGDVAREGLVDALHQLRVVSIAGMRGLLGLPR